MFVLTHSLLRQSVQNSESQKVDSKEDAESNVVELRTVVDSKQDPLCICVPQPVQLSLKCLK